MDGCLLEWDVTDSASPQVLLTVYLSFSLLFSKLFIGAIGKIRDLINFLQTLVYSSFQNKFSTH